MKSLSNHAWVLGLIICFALLPTAVFAQTTFATFTVVKDFLDDNTATVSIALTCSDGTVANSPQDANENTATNAVFTINDIPTPVTATCTATESPVPTGYTSDEATNCFEIALSWSGEPDPAEGTCTITNTPDAVDDTATVLEDASATTIDVLANDGGDPSLLSIASKTDPANGTVVITNAGADLTYEPDPDYCNDGSPTDDFTYTLTQGGDTATVAVTVTCVNDPPVITSVSPSSQTSDYSDYIGQVTITAEDIDSPTSGGDLSLAQVNAPASLPDPGLNTTAICVDAGLGQSCTWTMDGQVTVGERQVGSNIYNINFTANDGEDDSVCNGDPNPDPADCRHVLTVHAEDAEVDLDDGNAVAVQSASAGGNSGPFSLKFSAWETDDPDNPHDGTAEFGDLNNMFGIMRLNPVGPGSSVNGVCALIAPLPVYPGEGYDQVAYFECTFNNVPVNVYEVQASVGPNTASPYSRTFYRGGPDEDLFTVFDPSLGFTTGGGWFYWPDTAIPEDACLEYDEVETELCIVPDPCAGYPGDKTNFGFNMKYNKKKTNLQGSLLLMRHTWYPIDDVTCFEDRYKVKSNMLDGMAVGVIPDPDGYGWAVFNGKATFKEPGLDNVGNQQFLVYVEDHGDQGCEQDPTDEFWIQVKDSIGTVVLELNGPDPADEDPAVDGDDEPIMCGNIFVPHVTGGPQP